MEVDIAQQVPEPYQPQHFLLAGLDPARHPAPASGEELGNADGRERFIHQFENAARRAEVMAPAEAARLFHRAALRLRNIDGPVLDPEVDEAFGSVAAELREPKQDLIRRILREWLEANAYLPVLDIEEDGEVEGTA